MHEVLRLGLAERDPRGGDVPVVLTDAGRAYLAEEEADGRCPVCNGEGCDSCRYPIESLKEVA